MNDYILTLSCPDRTGIVYAVSGFLFERGCNIVDSAQFGDSQFDDTDRQTGAGLFFMRVHFASPPTLDHQRLQEDFAIVAQRFAMQWDIADGQRKARVLIMVSKYGHCLNDLLFRVTSGALPIDVPAVISNHPDFAPLCASYGVPFHHWPVHADADAPIEDSRAAQEQRVLDLIDHERIDLVVLARYMQILSPAMTERLQGRAINIHHSFLPSFKGARPYTQAHARGVKLIGATAHYVTSELDEGPIIEQDVARADHAMDPTALTALGRDVECGVLARAVQWHVERRVLLNGKKTVVFK